MRGKLDLLHQRIPMVPVDPVATNDEPIGIVGTDEYRAGSPPLVISLNAIGRGEDPQEKCAVRHHAIYTEVPMLPGHLDQLLVFLDREKLIGGIVRIERSIGHMEEATHPGGPGHFRTRRSERAEMMSIGAYQTGLRGDPEEFAAVHGQVEDAALGQTRTGIEVPNDTVLSSALPGHSCATTCQ